MKCIVYEIIDLLILLSIVIVLLFLQQNLLNIILNIEVVKQQLKIIFVL